MSALIGSIDHYVRGSSFASYMKRINILYQLNNVVDNNKKNLFLALSGSVIFDEIELIYPGIEIADIDYADMISKLKERLDKVQPNMMHRHKFHARVQGIDEPAENYVLALKLLASHCGFGAHKDEAIKDKIVFGLRDQDLKHKLLMKDDMTLEEVEQMVIRTELAKCRAKELEERDENPREVNSVKYRLGNRSSFNDMGRDDRQGSGNYGRRFRARSRSSSRDRERTRYNQNRYDNYNRQRDEYQSGTSYSDGRGNMDRNPHQNVICNFCKLRGHVKRNCYKLKNRKNVNFVEEAPVEINSYDFKRLQIRNSEDEDDDYPCMMIASNRFSDPCIVKVSVEGVDLEMEIDCGAAVTVISLAVYRTHFSHIIASKCSSRLVVVNGQQLTIFGEISVNVKANHTQQQVTLIILDSPRRFVPLFGRNWIDVFYPNWRRTFGDSAQINAMSKDADNSPKIDRGFEADLVLREDRPIFRKAYDVPFKLREKVVDHLESLEKQNIITPIQVSDWASPVVIVPKKDNDIRMVIDCKVSINKQIIPNTYPLPLAQDIFASLAGCKWFCCLDLAGAYTQLKLSERSKQFVVINTIKGLYTYNRLPQGASSSASIFQKVMDQILLGLKHIRCYLDDVLIAGETLEECLSNLYLVLERLQKANLKVNFKKCKFFVNSLIYLGHLVTDKGLLPSPEKLLTIEKAKVPTDTTELKAFLGLINFYGKFVPHLSAKLSCLYALLRKDTKFVWNEKCQQTFEESKQALITANFLEFYDPAKPIIVVSDACSYGLGGVIAHMVDGNEKPISFTSFSLNSAQKTYPILHLEALALVCTVKKFHKFLFGQKFTVYTDHKPLLGIFGKNGNHSLCVTRLQRYVMEMSIYEFDICYRPSAKMGNADFCSRFPLNQDVPTKLDSGCIKSINYFGDFPLDYSLIARQTKMDNFLSKVADHIENGWPKKVHNEWRQIFSLRYDLEIVEGCVMYQDRVFIPISLKNDILRLLHSNHNGVVKMKQIARRSLYWFDLNKDIEQFVKHCEPCIKMSVVPKPICSTSWIPTNRPFSRIHADFFFLESKTYLLVVDSYTKWLEVELMKYGTDASKVIKKFSAIFSRFGLPDVLVTDGGPPFNSSHFVKFMERQGIKVMKSPPYNPSSNGQAERMVRLVKDVLKKFLLDPLTKSLDDDDRLTYFLANYRNTCSASDDRFPSEKLLSYKPKTLVDLLHPRRRYNDCLVSKDSSSLGPPKEEKTLPNDNSKRKYDSLPPQDPFLNLSLGDKIWYKNNDKHAIEKWVEVKYVKRVSPNVFEISFGRHNCNAHRNQLKIVDKRQSRSTIRLPIQRQKRRRESIETEEDFLGFEDETNAAESDLARKQKFIRTSPIRTRSVSRSKKRKDD
ncbi:uncharacterized protein K02A2.6-like isoform X1 [Aedes albopictus]|uniref:RNA-directed DNA polymerase n=1 Tax=Aedes albopictus TaxID=7160 RepID=A0ABM1YWW6_AEDAL